VAPRLGLPCADRRIALRRYR